MTGLSEDLLDQFERIFLSPTDSGAAEALQILEVDHKKHNWSASERSSWSRFLLSLLLRMPEDVEAIKRVTEFGLRELEPELVQRYNEVRGDDHPPTFAEWIEQNDPNLFANAAMQILQRLIDQEGLGQRFNEMIWETVSVEKGNHQLFTSDRPLVIPYALLHPQG